jgi:hypothetical protein
LTLETGLFLNESMLMFAWDGEPKKVKFDINLSNHMTSEQNQAWANKILELLNR